MCVCTFVTASDWIYLGGGDTGRYTGGQGGGHLTCRTTQHLQLSQGLTLRSLSKSLFCILFNTGAVFVPRSGGGAGHNAAHLPFPCLAAPHNTCRFSQDLAFLSLFKSLFRIPLTRKLFLWRSLPALVLVGEDVLFPPTLLVGDMSELPPPDPSPPGCTCCFRRICGWKET